MKTIKKCFKQILCVAVFALLAVLFAFNPTAALFNRTGVSAETVVSTYKQAILNAVQMPIRDVDLEGDNNELRIPLLTKKNGTVEVPANYYIRVIDPIGAMHDFEVKSGAASDDYFEYHAKADSGDELTKNGYVKVKNLVNGFYHISYYFKATDSKSVERCYFSAQTEVYVKNVSFELTFITPEGENQLTKSTVQKGDKINLPVAYVKYSGKDEYYMSDEKVATVEPKLENITKNGKPLTAESNEFSSEGGKYTLTPADLGTYAITYTYAGKITVVKTFDVLNTYDGTATLSISVKDLTMPSVQLGQKDIKLPALTVNNGDSTNIDHNVVITIKKEGSSISQTLAPNTYTFDMTLDKFFTVSGETKTPVASYADLIGNYTVTYNVKDAYNNENDFSFTLFDVTDATAPTAYLAYSYDIQHAEWAIGTGENDLPYLKKDGGTDPISVEDVDTSFAVDVKTNYGYAELYFPAIYATDLVSNYEDFTFVRYLQSTSNSSLKLYLDNVRYTSDGNVAKVKSGEAGYNYATGENTGIGKFNQVVRYQFKTEGSEDYKRYLGKEYSLRYQVIAHNLADNGTQQSFVLADGEYYKVNILDVANVVASDSEHFSKNPTIKINLNGDNIYVAQNEEISFTVTSTDELDKRLKNIVFYYTENESKTDAEIATEIQKIINKIAFNTESETLGGNETVQDSYFTGFSANVLDRAAFDSAMKASSIFGDSYTKFEAKSNEEFSTTLSANAKDKIKVVAVTINDNHMVAVATKNYIVKNTTEANAPRVSTITNATKAEGAEGEVLTTEYTEDGENGLKEQSFGQSVVVLLPKVVFNDEEDNSLNLSVRYYIISDEFNAETDRISYLKVNDLVANRSTIESATITTSAVGRYYVVYTAQDDAGNQTFIYFTFEVIDTSKPVLYVDVNGESFDDSFKYTESQSISANIDTVISFVPTLWDSTLTKDITKYDTEPNVNVVVTGNPSPDTIGESETVWAYLFTEPGDYIATITGFRTADPASKIYAEPITIDIHIDVPTLAWNDLQKAKDSVNPSAAAGSKVYLPDLTASQGRVEVEYTVTVTGKSHGEMEVKTDAKGRYFEIPATDETNPDNDIDVYTIKFAAKTKYGSLQEETIGKVRVGDDIKPTFSYADNVEAELGQDIVYDGTNSISYAIELDKNENTLNIVISGNGKEIRKIETGLKIDDETNNPNRTNTKVYNWEDLNVSLVAVDNQSLADPTTEENTKTYTISAIGKYKIVLTYSDNADNEGRNEFVFNVVSKTQPKKVSDNVVGIVLIVVSLVILAGVILFFALTGKKGGNGKTKTNKTNKKAAAQVAETVENTDTDAKSGDVE